MLIRCSCFSSYRATQPIPPPVDLISRKSCRRFQLESNSASTKTKQLLSVIGSFPKRTSLNRGVMHDRGRDLRQSFNLQLHHSTMERRLTKSSLHLAVTLVALVKKSSKSRGVTGIERRTSVMRLRTFSAGAFMTDLCTTVNQRA